MNFFQRLHLTRFSAPVDERAIYRHILQTCPITLVECGIQRGERMLNMLRLVEYRRRSLRDSNSLETEDFLYVCTDPFEGRTEIDGPGLSLRKAHKLLSRFNLKHRCLPGPGEMGIAQISRSVKDIDLAVLATPNYDWLASKGALLAAAMKDDATLFLKRPESEFQAMDLESFRQLIDLETAVCRKERKTAA